MLYCRMPTLRSVTLYAILLLSRRSNGFSPANTGLTSRRSCETRFLISTQLRVSSRAAAGRGKKRTSDGKRKKKKNVPRSKSIHVERKQQAPAPLLIHYDDALASQADRLSDPVLGSTCEHFSVCAGCTIGENVAKTHVVDAAERYFASERYDGAQQKDNEHQQQSSFPVLIPSPLTQWRTQAKLVATNKSQSSWIHNGCVFGLYRRGSHEVVPIPECVVHHPAINQATALLEQATATARIAGYSQVDRDGQLRFVQLQVERTTGKVCLTLVWNAGDLKQCQPGLSRLVKVLQQQPLWHSIWCHCNDGMGNNIFSRNTNSWHRLCGQEYLREPIPVAQEGESEKSVGWFYFSPRVFRQGNLDGFDMLALDVAKSVPGNSKVCELYAGVGVLGLTALAFHHTRGEPLGWLRCSDENPSNPRAFHRAVASLPPEMTGRFAGKHSRARADSSGSQTLGDIASMVESGRNSRDQFASDGEKTFYTAASALQAIRSGQALGANVLIVDPPRKGLEAEVLEELCKSFNPNQPYVEDANLLALEDEQINWLNDVQTLVYVSCGFDALARDCDQLLSSRGAGWTLERTTGYLLFPGSDHVETLAIYQRK